MSILPELPKVYSTQMIEQLLKGIDKMLVKAKENQEHCFKQRFLDSADEEGISRFEKIEGIVPFAGQDVDSRRMACITKWNNFIPYTEKTLIKMLDSWCGTGNYIYGIEEDKDNECMIFTLQSNFSYNAQANAVYQQLNIILPMNFIILIKNNASFDVITDINFSLISSTNIKLESEG